MLSISHDLLINMLAAAFFIVFGIDIASQNIRRIPRLYWQKLKGEDLFKNMYGKYFCYRIRHEGDLAVFNVTIKRGYGLAPVCIWESVRSSSAPVKGRVLREGSKYALIFDNESGDRLPSVIIVHAEGVVETKNVKIGFQTGILSTRPSALFSGTILMSRLEIETPQKYLNKTMIIDHSDYTSTCLEIAQRSSNTLRMK